MTLQGCVLFFSLMHNVDPTVTNAVIAVESGGNPLSISRDKQDFGLLQIRKKFHKLTTAQLLQPCTNIELGVKILAAAKKRCKHRVDNLYLVCYNAGVAGGSRLKYPRRFPYYKKVIAAMRRG